MVVPEWVHWPDPGTTAFVSSFCPAILGVWTCCLLTLSWLPELQPLHSRTPCLKAGSRDACEVQKIPYQPSLFQRRAKFLPRSPSADALPAMWQRSLPGRLGE